MPAAQSCAYVLTLALEVATCAEATVAAAGPSQSPDLAPERARGQGLWPCGYRWSRVGFGPGNSNGEAPRSRRGWNKEGKSEGRQTTEEEKEEEAPWNAEGPGE